MTDAPTSSLSPPPAAPSGFGGWLILPMIGTSISPVFYLLGGYDVLRVAFGPHIAKVSGLFQAIVWIEAVVNVAMLVAWLAAVVLMFRKRALYPRLFVSLSLASLAIVLMDMLASGALMGVPFTIDDAGTIIRQVIACIIWIPYMMRSVRVKNTFVL